MSRERSAAFLAELAGTALLVGIGTGTIVAASTRGGIPQWELGIAWAVAVLVPLLLFVRSSGAHLNPAVSLVLVIAGRFPARRVPEYWAAQLLGALLASEVVRRGLGPRHHLGATVPTSVSPLAALLLEVAGTSVLLTAVLVLASADRPTSSLRLALPPAAVGGFTFLIGPLTGCSLNPARTLGPAIVSATYAELWVYLVAPIVAALAVGSMALAATGRLRPGRG